MLWVGEAILSLHSITPERVRELVPSGTSVDESDGRIIEVQIIGKSAFKAFLKALSDEGVAVAESRLVAI
jgi:hypothetical protein